MVRWFVACLVLLLAACQAPGSKAGCQASIEWLDFVQLGSIEYIAVPGGVLTPQESDLGLVVAHVKFKLSGNVCDPHYRPKDGDAGLLDPGTPIYAINGHPPSELLAARREGTIRAYEAHPEPYP